MTYKLLLLFLSTFSWSILYMDIPDLPDLNDLREMVEYWQDQIFSIDEGIKEDGLDKDNQDLTPKQITDKQAALEAKKESIANRKNAMKDYSEAKARNDSSGLSVKKRPTDSSEKGPSKK